MDMKNKLINIIILLFIKTNNKMNEYKFTTPKGDYETWDIYNADNNLVEDDNLNPLQHKLFNNDIYILNKENLEIIDSEVRKKNIPGVLVLENNRKYGSVNKKYLYKCIPDDITIPMFLIPYVPTIGFNKKMFNKYIIFKYDNWDGKHPIGRIIEIFGDVDIVQNFYNYQLHCKNIFISKKPFDKKIIKKLKTKSIDEHIKDIMNKYNIIDDTERENIYSIDPKGSKDIDDAVSIDRLDSGGFKLSIYIANVPIWLDYFNAWDDITNQTATIYMPTSKRTMLPKVLSDNICSLLENKSRISFVLDIHFNEKMDMTSCNFSNKLINVKKNMKYNDNLNENKDYNLLYNFIKHLNEERKYIDEIKDSHDVVAYTMILMNYLSALELKKNKNGLFRSITLKQDIKTDIYSPNINKFLTLWKNNTCKYCDYDEIGPHDLLKLESYTHITSPIRRIIDIINMTILQSNNQILQLNDEIKRFLHKWESNISDINQGMSSIKKVQNDCKLLHLCNNNFEVLNNTYEGFIFEKTIKKNRFKYSVYLPSLRMVNKYNTTDDIDIMTSHSFEIYIFMDAIRLKQKIQLKKY